MQQVEASGGSGPTDGSVGLLGIEKAALAAGATMLGEVPGLHYIFSVEELAQFVALVAVAPPPPY